MDLNRYSYGLSRSPLICESMENEGPEQTITTESGDNYQLRVEIKITEVEGKIRDFGE